ncbi:hypothetical protein B0H19DRAFT_1058471 [Mycena capillaripes]|nr:hypothetical protein B0H19DRAFT_1058471 [Mycena capillaripes]
MAFVEAQARICFIGHHGKILCALDFDFRAGCYEVVGLPPSALLRPSASLNLMMYAPPRAPGAATPCEGFRTNATWGPKLEPERREAASPFEKKVQQESHTIPVRATTKARGTQGLAWGIQSHVPVSGTGSGRPVTRGATGRVGRAGRASDGGWGRGSPDNTQNPDIANLLSSSAPRVQWQALSQAHWGKLAWNSTEWTGQTIITSDFEAVNHAFSPTLLEVNTLEQNWARTPTAEAKSAIAKSAKSAEFMFMDSTSRYPLQATTSSLADVMLKIDNYIYQAADVVAFEELITVVFKFQSRLIRTNWKEILMKVLSNRKTEVLEGRRVSEKEKQINSSQGCGILK